MGRRSSGVVEGASRNFVEPGAAAGIVERVRRIAPAIREAADASESERRPDPGVVQLLRDAGVFRMAMPASLGGPETDPLTQIRVVEEISRADPSAGWFAMIGSDGGYYSAFVDDRVARAVWGRDLDAVTAGFTDPAGTATVADGGYVLSGRWPFATGCQYARWLASGCVVHDERGPRLRPDCKPEWRVMIVPAEQCRIVDTWSVTGLLGTGSHDYEMERVFVPGEYSFSFFDAPRHRGPLFAQRTMFRVNMVGVPLGAAAAALEACYRVSARRMRRRGDDPDAAGTLARAQALVESCRAYVFHVIAELWEKLTRRETPTVQDDARVRLAIATVFTSCREALLLLYRVAGGEAVYRQNLLDRYLRDIVTASQHAIAQDRSYRAVGRAMLGCDPGELLL